MRKLLPLCVLALLLCAAAPFSAFSASRRSLSSVAGCSRIFAYSSGSTAYFYGYTNAALCSAQAVPDGNSFTVTAGGVITCAAHDSRRAYALVRVQNLDFSLLTLDMSSGAYQTVRLDSGAELDSRSVAVSGGEVFLIVNARQAYVQSYGTDGSMKNRYAFSDNPMTLFINSDRAYVLTYQGDVYRLANGAKVYCGNVGSYAKLCDAGAGYVMTDSGLLLDLNSGQTQRVNADFGCAVMQGGVPVTYSGGTLRRGSAELPSEAVVCLAAANGKIAALSDSGDCTVYSESDFEAPAAKGTGSGTIQNLSLGTTVAGLRRDYPDAEVYDSGGARKTGGKLKTGDVVVQNGTRTTVVLVGDVTGNGICGANDVRRMMLHLCQAEPLTGAYLSAADLNGDGRVSNADLVLAARLKNETKK